MYPGPNVPHHGKSLYKPYITWVFMGCNPRESLENTINTMATLLGVHPIVPWTLETNPPQPSTWRLMFHFALMILNNLVWISWDIFCQTCTLGCSIYIYIFFFLFPMQQFYGFVLLRTVGKWGRLDKASPTCTTKALFGWIFTAPGTLKIWTV